MALGFGNSHLVAQRILGRLHSEDFQETGSLCGVHDELRGLEKTISGLTPLLLRAEEKAAYTNSIIDWLKLLEKKLDEADIVLEDLATGATYLRRGNKMPKQVRSFFSYPGFSQLSMRLKIKDINKRLDELTEAQGRDFGLEWSSDKKIQFPNGVEDALSFIVQGGGGASIRSLWDDVAKKEIINILLDMKFEQNVTVLPILGTETTMFVMDVFNDGRVRKHFDKQIWLSIFDSSRDGIQVTKVAGLRKELISDMDELIKLLSSSLSRVRYLIVLNNMLFIDQPKCWLFLRDLIGIGNKGSKIIVTTHKEEVAISITRTIQPYHLNCPSSEDELWNIFAKVAFGQQPKKSSMIYVGNCIVKEIVKRPSLLPLVTAAIGSMLYFENSEVKWRFFYQNILPRIENFPFSEFPFAFRWPVVYQYHKDSDLRVHQALLGICYHHLPLPLKYCFAYCSLFPKDYEIDVQTTIKLWMAQGFIIDEPGKSLEDVGYEYFLNLLRRSFFQEPIIDVKERVIKCKMHHLMHDLATTVAGKQCFLFSPEAFHDHEDDYSHVSFESGLFSAEVARYFYSSRIRSFLLQSQIWGKYGGRSNHEVIDRIISTCTHLRALDLRAMGIKIVPYSIGELKFLKYLDLSENGDVTKLPNSITNLLNLQTLKLSSCFKLRNLPRDIQNLVNLRHLEIDGCYSLSSLPRGFGQLSSLRTLTQFVLSEDSMHDFELNALKALVSLREELQIKNIKHEKDVTAYLNAVPCGVRSLSLEWDSHAPKSYYNETPTEDIKLSSDLQELTINGFIGVTLFSPSNSIKLVKLTLRRCSNCENLPSLDQLLHLKVLILDEMIRLECISNEDSSSASTIFFPCLQELWLTELPELKGWWKNRVGDSELPSFPQLSKLVIEDCRKLASMPLFPTLEQGLVLDTTQWGPFKLTMSNQASSSSSSSPPLSKLKNLCIVGIEDLNDSNVGEITWATLQSLRFLRLDCLPQLTTLPSELRDIISLQELHIWRCGMNDIDAIEALQYLEKIVIRVCPTLESLPDGIRSLQHLRILEIEDCPTLLRRCEKKTGADWHKIAHIAQKRLPPISGR